MNVILISLFFAIATLQPHAVSMEEFLESECDKGVQKDCESLAELREQLIKQKRLQARAVLYGERINGNGPMLDEKVRLPGCANHYHNYWVNKKLWWPTDDAHNPDWASIYVFIVDHYYGYCLKS